MAGLEDMMAGLFGGTEAAGLDEMRRRRGAPGRGNSYEGIGGALVQPGQMMPYYGGLNTYDFSGASGGQLERSMGRQGLMSLLAEAQGPALRHFARQGFDFMPPGQDNRESPGGPNIAPGNIDTGRALDQPQGNLTPGVPQGVARGQAPGQVQPRPQTQGWRNIHPGYSATAAYGTDPSGRPIGFGGPQGGGRPVGAPAAQSGQAPGTAPGGGGGGNRGQFAGGPAGGGGGGSQNPIGGGTRAIAPGAGGGANAGGASAGGKQTGGGGPSGVTPQVQQQARQQPTARGGQTGGVQSTAGIDKGPGGKPKINPKTGGVTSQGQGVLQGPTANGPSTEVFVPNQGNNNTPSELQGAPEPGKLAGLSAKEKAERKAAWQAKVLAKQERARVKAAPSASQFGATSEVNVRGTGTAPLPRPGKTRPARNGRTGFQRGQR